MKNTKMTCLITICAGLAACATIPLNYEGLRGAGYSNAQLIYWCECIKIGEGKESMKCGTGKEAAMSIKFAKPVQVGYAGTYNKFYACQGAAERDVM